MDSGLAASRGPGMTARRLTALILQQLDRGVEDLAGIGVALAFHLLHPLVPDRLAGDLGPARQLIGWHSVAVEVVVAGLCLLDPAFFRGIEQVLAPELRARQPAYVHDRVRP